MNILCILCKFQTYMPYVFHSFWATLGLCWTHHIRYGPGLDLSIKGTWTRFLLFVGRKFTIWLSYAWVSFELRPIYHVEWANTPQFRQVLPDKRDVCTTWRELFLYEWEEGVRLLISLNCPADRSEPQQSGSRLIGFLRVERSNCLWPCSNKYTSNRIMVQGTWMGPTWDPVIKWPRGWKDPTR